MSAAADLTRFEIPPMTAAIGAGISGINLKQPLDPETREELRRALGVYLVLGFRDQWLEDDAHIALAECFGKPEVHPIRAALGAPVVLHDIVDTEDSVPDRDGWHSDVTYMQRPPKAAVLRCEQAPESGGDTLWANMRLAYDKLSDAMKTLLDGLSGHHATEGGFIDYIKRHLPADAVERIINLVGDGAHHPLVRTDPATGQKMLFVDQSYLLRIDGLPEEESRFLLDFLASRVHDVSIQCRFRWTPGAVVVWDETATQHSGAADHRGSARTLRRCTIEGEVPS